LRGITAWGWVSFRGSSKKKKREGGGVGLGPRGAGPPGKWAAPGLGKTPHRAIAPWGDGWGEKREVFGDRQGPWVGGDGFFGAGRRGTTPNGPLGGRGGASVAGGGGPPAGGAFRVWGGRGAGRGPKAFGRVGAAEKHREQKKKTPQAKARGAREGPSFGGGGPGPRGGGERGLLGDGCNHAPRGGASAHVKRIRLRRSFGVGLVSRGGGGKDVGVGAIAWGGKLGGFNRGGGNRNIPAGRMGPVFRGRFGFHIFGGAEKKGGAPFFLGRARKINPPPATNKKRATIFGGEH